MDSLKKVEIIIDLKNLNKIKVNTRIKEKRMNSTILAVVNRNGNE